MGAGGTQLQPKRRSGRSHGGSHVSAAIGLAFGEVAAGNFGESGQLDPTRFQFSPDLIGEIAQQALGHVGRGHPQTTGAGGFHGGADIRRFSLPLLEIRRAGLAAEPLRKPRCSDAAGEALAAGFVGEEIHGIVRHFDHVAGIVENNDARRAEEGALAPDAGFVERGVQIITSEEPAGQTGHGDSLNGSALARAAGPFVKQRFQRQADGDLVIAGVLDVAGKADQFCAGVFAETKTLIPLGSVAEDGSD